MYETTCTVGSRLSELRLSIFEHLNIGSRRHVFGASGKKTWLLQFCYRRKQSCCMNNFSRMLQRLFHPVLDLNHDLHVQRLSLLIEVANAVVHYNYSHVIN